MPTIVPDASVVAKWHDPEEIGWDVAQRILGDVLRRAVRLTAPDHLKVEVIRTLQMAVRDKRCTLDDGIRRVETFFKSPIAYVPNDQLFLDAFRLASNVQMALYDALYVALAERLGVPFLTADRRLYNLARQRGLATVVWFEDYQPPA